ncbi:DgyrCDS12485 [Dimorphilus gyrociliatus]|uniref:DgyrCDS12485 n=1 Tax=Dimorphilus gyrociliatus TaxID=2664684 RepID=A0A7I8W7R1_9ANNE|nr:DgyrCDS12485 [Dimorphilus gyrociliatus]
MEHKVLTISVQKKDETNSGIGGGGGGEGGKGGSSIQERRMKGKFHGIALRILAKVMAGEKLDVEEEKEEKRKITSSSQKIENISPKSPKTPKTPLTPKRTESRKQLYRRKGVDFRNVVRLASMKHFNRVLGTTTEKNEVLEEDSLPKLPPRPRFSATLSPEAQLVTLMCYEEAISEKLSTTNNQPKNEKRLLNKRSSIDDQRRLLVSSRVERAMSLLDIAKKEDTKVLRHFKSWTLAWSKDFE